MRSISLIAKGGLVIVALGLSACATSGVSVEDMYKPNFGRYVFPHFDASANPDPGVVANGLYVPRAYRAGPPKRSYSSLAQSSVSVAAPPPVAVSGSKSRTM